jgi:hypothetical protein
MVLCEGKIMRRCLLLATLVLTTVWATGCIVVDAGRTESRTPATIRSEECVIRQNLAVGTPVFEPGSDAARDVTGGQ